MKYLDYIYNYLNLSTSIGFQTNRKQKKDVRISINRINKSIFFVYFFFSFMMILFLCLFFLSSNKPEHVSQKTIDIFMLRKLIVISLLIFVVCTIQAFIRRFIVLKVKESKPYNADIYKRDLPSNLTPAHVRLLMEDGLIDKKTLASTILDLIDRGYLALESDDRSGLFSKDLYISLTTKSHDDLFEYEKFMINWFFESKKISSADLRLKLNDVKNNPCEKFATFQALVLISFPLNKYYKKCNSKKGRSINIVLFLSFFLFVFILLNVKSIIVFGIGEFLVLFGLANLLFSLPNYLLNDSGAELKDNYLDLKNFLLDFSLIKDKTSEMIVLWNYYLSYSVALGIEGIASNEIESFFGNEIYNYNVSYVFDENLDAKTFIDRTPEIIYNSETLYNNK